MSQGQWANFTTPEPPLAETASAEGLSTEVTGGITQVLPIDPDFAARQNELSRQRIEGGAAIITVDPGAQPADRDLSGEIIIRDPSTLGQNLRMAHLPVPDLIENTESGRLPRVGPDGSRPVEAYARPWSGSAGPRIALVIGGLGLSQTGTQDAIRKLPEDVTLAFASTGNSLDRWVQMARGEGHEVLVQIPLEPLDYPAVNPGRNTLTTDASPAENRGRLHWALGRMTNYTGVINHLGTRFSADAEAMQTMMEEIGRRGLLYLDDGTTSRSVAAPLSASLGVPFVQGTRVIDAARGETAILARLNELEQIARSQGVAVGVGSAFDETVSAVAAFMREAERRGIEFVPVSAVALR